MLRSDTHELLKDHPIIPVVILDDVSQAVPVAEALLAGGVSMMEITLRTEAAPAAIESITRDVPEMTVGAGTLRTAADFALARNAGARFVVSPGATPAMLAEAGLWDLPYLPGAATPSEIMALKDAGYDTIKFYPAEQLGGAAVLSTLTPLFPEILFCPSGGIGKTNFNDYLRLPNVISVAGSWLTPGVAIESHNAAYITEVCTTSLEFLDRSARGP